MAISQSFIMAGHSISLVLAPKSYCRIRARVSSHPKTLSFLRLEKSHPCNLSSRSYSNTRLNAAGLSEIEPDLSEGARDRWATNGISPDEFVYGEYDGHHTYHEGHEGTFWEGVVSEYTAAEPPSGFQGIMSWLFLPAMAAGLVYHVPGEYLYIGAAVFVVIFCAIEMGKPDKPHNFEPQIYNMERGARDKLIADYNSMDIWDFNEKYGDLWDFTVNRDDIVR
ncbi:photosynthetic NDH subunit of subcomplex B 5, chloroplastic-like [Magnolia sinica]|uniref:photosynthetic NDH subunit of subcomplex B 5, chloroplastic-like n=1 Tax=Magnolia sinica TaxID=86752 RepID=UPI00265ADA0B|nr:photosynthetic NDH subunit of subcomplex B 5, chloroplastic-like [Magnolia sinica]